MSKSDDLTSKIQSKIDNTKEARSSSSGYKHTISAGTQGVGNISKK